MPTYGDHNTRLVFYDPSRTLAAIVTDFLSFKCTIAVLAQGSLEVVVPRRSKVWTSTYSGNTARADRWLNWSFDFYWRGVKVFSGPVVNAKIEHQGQEGTAYATLTCVPWFQWFTSGRTIETDTNGPYSKTATAWDNIFRDLLRTQCVSGSITKPTGYPGTVTRSNFGPFTVAVESDTSTASTTDWKIEQNKPLFDTLIDLCMEPASQADHLWPKTSETAAGTFQLGCYVGRTGGSRQIGTDRTATVLISGVRGEIAAGTVEYDHEALASCWKISGKGRAANQGFNYVTDTTVYSKIGCREDALTVRVAGTAAERQAEARRMAWLSNWENGRKVDFVLTERDALRFGVDFNVADSITVYDHVLEESSAQMVILAEITMVAPGPPSVKLGFGKMPRNETREVGRSGGGGGGGGRSGGSRPKETQGEHDYVVAGGDCVTVTTDEDEGQTTYTVSFTQKTWGPVEVNGAQTLTPSTCFQTLQIIGDRCIEVVKIDGDTIHVRNTHYWINKVTVVDPAFTLTADSCDEQVNFAGSNGITLSGSGNTITISGASIHRYATVNGDSGSASASGADTLKIIGGDGIKTVAGDGSPDGVTINVRLPLTTATEISANYLKVWDAAGNARAVKTWPATS